MITRALKLVSITFYAIAFSLFFHSCDNDDEITDSMTPEVSELTDDISSAPGLTFTIEGELNDENGIETVGLYYPDWYLDKLITFKDAPKDYFLKYSFMTPTDAEPESVHNIKVSITDKAGNIATHDVVVTLDYDVTRPEIEVIDPVAGSSFPAGEPFALAVNFSDDKALDSVKIFNAGLGLDLMLDLEDGAKTYEYAEEIIIPAEDPENSYSIEVTAIDATGNTTQKVITILVGESSGYNQVYAVGGSMWWEWDVSKATQMWKDPNDENWFVLEFYYWTGYGIKFTGQLDWQPNNWGLDPNDPTKMINADNSEVIEFPDGDGYYRVKFNPYTMEYTYEKMVNDMEVKTEMYIVGHGYPDYPNLDWNPEEAIPMDPDPWGNPYVFTAWIQISDDTSMKFLGQNTGWSPYDCGFEVGGEQQMPVNFAKNKVGDGSSDLKFYNQAGWYYITFDYFLNRTTIHEYNP